MRVPTLFLSAALAATMACSSIPSAGRDAAADPSTVAAPGASAVGQAIQSIAQAPDPSSAIQAYARAQAIVPGDPSIDAAYVRRMVDFGLPEMADAQARNLTLRQPNNGLAWAVAAYMQGRRGQTTAALADILSAARLLPDEPFVIRTAAQLLAWYDTKADRSRIVPSVQQALDAMRQQLGGQPVFVSAYQQARDAYQTPAVEGAAAATSESTAQVQLPPDTYAYSPPPGASVYNNYYYSGAYTDPFAYSGPSYWCPAPAYAPAYWWPDFTGVVIVGGGFFHHRGDFFHHDHGRFINAGGHGFAHDNSFFRHSTELGHSGGIGFGHDGPDRGLGHNTARFTPSPSLAGPRNMPSHSSPQHFSSAPLMHSAGPMSSGRAAPGGEFGRAGGMATGGIAHGGRGGR